MNPLKKLIKHHFDLNSVINKDIHVTDLGSIDFKEAWDYQTVLFEKALAIKTRNRSLPAT